MRTAQIALRSGQVAIIAIVASFLVPSLFNDVRDLIAQTHGAAVPSCATFSLVRPPCR